MIQPLYNETGHSGYGGNPANISQYSPRYDPNMAANQAKPSSSFWADWASSIESSGGSGSSGLGSSIGGAGGGALGTYIGGPVGGVIGSELGSIAGSAIEGGIMGGGESGKDKLNRELAQSEHETRRWEERNAAPSAGLGNYMARAMALQGMPMLSMINGLDFFMNKVYPYYNDYMRKGVGKALKRRKR